MKPSLDELQQICEFVLDVARKQGAQECSVSANESVGNSVSWRQGKVQELSRERDVNVRFTVYKEGKKGSVSLSDNSPNALTEGVKAALTSAQFTESDPYVKLAESKYLADVSQADFAKLDLWHDDLPDVQALKDMARCAEEAAYDYDKKVANSDGSEAYAEHSKFWQAASNGFSQGTCATRTGLNVSVIAKDGDNQQSNYAYDTKRAMSDLLSPTVIGREAAEKAVSALNPRSVKTGSYPILFTPQMAAGIIGHLLAAFGGRTQFRKLGFLTGAKGSQILPEWLSLVENPYLPRGASSALFDSEGIAVNEPILVKNGVLARYLLSSYSARRLNMTPTGNSGGVHNLQLQANAAQVKPLKDLYRDMECGVIVTSLMGQGVNGLTGDYSRGASGFWVEHGEIQYPVEGITIASNLKDMFKGITALGDDVDTRGAVHAPSLLIRQMTVAG